MMQLLSSCTYSTLYQYLNINSSDNSITHSDRTEDSHPINMMHLLILPSLLSLVLGQAIYPPIPMVDTDPGLVYDPQGLGFTGEVRLEAFLELNCGDSVAAWPVLQEVKQHYGAKVELVVHQFPLPYHRNGFLCTQGMALIHDQLPDEVFDYMEGVLDRYIRFTTGLTRRQSELDVIENLADVAINVTSIDRDDFVQDINNYTGTVVRLWKYATRRGVSGTPWFAVNNIDVGVNPSVRLSLQDWIEFLDPLLEDSASN